METQNKKIIAIADTELLDYFFDNVPSGSGKYIHCTNGRMERYAFYSGGLLWELRTFFGTNEAIISQMSIAEKHEVDNSIMFFADTLINAVSDDIIVKLSRNKRENGLDDLFVTLYKKDA